VDVNYFLYRRLCRWVTCKLRLPFAAGVSLASKYDVASFQDVFCHPFYWQAFARMEEPPQLVVDCGANCGHFSVLIDSCIRVKFGKSRAHYVLVEPNPLLLPILKRNLEEAGLASRSEIVSGLLGPKSGASTLWVHPKNFLASSLMPFPGASPTPVSFIDLKPVLDDQPIDVLKIDIEGGEYAFIDSNRDVLELTTLLMMEVHQAAPETQAVMLGQVRAAGFESVGQSVDADGLSMRAWARRRQS
jgi:FkbM family methyltransferase